MVLRDIVLAGKGDYKYSALLQALLWGYTDAHFEKGDNPFNDYKGLLEFWGDMKGPRWIDFRKRGES